MSKSKSKKRCTKNVQRKTKVKPMPHKWTQVIGLMTVGGLNFTDAMRQTGYADSYINSGRGHAIKTDTRFCTALATRQAAIETKSEDLRERRIETLNTFIEDSDIPVRDRIAAIKELGAICGWHSETIRHESTERQVLLDDMSRREAARLASLALDTRSLPDVIRTRKTVTSDTIDSDSVGSDTTSVSLKDRQGVTDKSVGSDIDDTDDIDDVKDKQEGQ
jgi:hypothetical protein